jgi:hypothetical protein
VPSRWGILAGSQVAGSQAWTTAVGTISSPAHQRTEGSGLIMQEAAYQFPPRGSSRIGGRDGRHPLR